MPLVGSNAKSLLCSGCITLIPNSQQKLSFVGLHWVERVDCIGLHWAGLDCVGVGLGRKPHGCRCQRPSVLELVFAGAKLEMKP